MNSLDEIRGRLAVAVGSSFRKPFERLDTARFLINDVERYPAIEAFKPNQAPEGDFILANLGYLIHANQNGFDTRQVKADAARFKEFIEKRGVESGGWRGDVDASPQSGTGTV